MPITSKTTKYCFLSLGINVLFALLLSIPIFFINADQYGGLTWLLIALAIFGVSVFIQLIIGIALIIGEKKRELGKAMVLTVGIILVIGFSICSPMLLGTN